MSPGHLSLLDHMRRVLYQLPKLLTTSLRGYAADVSPMWRDAAENSVGQVVMRCRVKRAGPRGNVFA